MSIVPSHKCVTHAVCTDGPHDRCLLRLVKVWMVPFVFGTENSTSIFLKNKWKCGLIWSQHTFFWTILDKLWPNIAFSVRNRDSICNAAADCGKWQWFFEVILSPCGYVEHCSMTVSYAMPSEGSKVMHSLEVSCLALHRLRFLWIHWIFSLYYVL